MWRQGTASFVLAISLVASLASASPTPVEEAKTETKVLQRARAGRSQDLIVQLQDEAILQRSRLARQAILDEVGRAKAWEPDTLSRLNSLNAATGAELRALIDEVFRSPPMAGVSVREQFDSIGMAVVEVSNLDALTRLLRHPKVRQVRINRKLMVVGMRPGGIEVGGRTFKDVSEAVDAVLKGEPDALTVSDCSNAPGARRQAFEALLRTRGFDGAITNHSFRHDCPE